MSMIIESIMNLFQELLTEQDHVYINNCFPTQPSLAGQDDKLGTQLWDMTIDLLSRKLGYEIKFE